jgi:hypothetical protein
VVEELGTEADLRFRHGISEQTETVLVVGEDGKTKKVKEKVKVVDPNGISIYAKFFDEACANWNDRPELNLVFLRGQQNYANDLLHARGHLFLNEVYAMLGIPHTTAGAIVGWTISKDADNYVDFGIYELNKMKARDFVNGYERSILLDFNVDGVIYDKI